MHSRFLASGSMAGGTVGAMSSRGPELLGVDGVHHFLASTLVMFESGRSIVAVSLNLVADGFGRFGFDCVDGRLEGVHPPGVMGQGSGVLVGGEVVAGLSIPKNAGGDAG